MTDLPLRDPTAARQRLLGLAIACAALLAIGCGADADLQKPTASAEALYDRGRILLERGETEQAIAALSQAIEREPRNPQLHAERGIAHEAAGDIDAALADYAEAIVLKPDYVPALNNRAAIYGRQDRFEEALADLQVSAGLDARQPLVLTNLGLVLLDLDRPNEAIAPLQAALALEPDSAVTRLIIARALVRAERPAEAEAVLQEAIAADTASPDALTALARLLIDQHRYDDAADVLEQADDSPAVNRLRDLAEERGAVQRFVASSDDFDRVRFDGDDAVALIAGDDETTAYVIRGDDGDGYRLAADLWVRALDEGASLLLVGPDGVTLRAVGEITEPELEPTEYRIQP